MSKQEGGKMWREKEKSTRDINNNNNNNNNTNDVVRGGTLWHQQLTSDG